MVALRCRNFHHSIANVSDHLTRPVGKLLMENRFRCARIRRVGIRNLAADDYLMILAGVCISSPITRGGQTMLTICLAQCFYTLLVSCLNVIAQGGGSNLFLPEEFATFTEMDIQERIKGSKIVVVSEQVRILAFSAH